MMKLSQYINEIDMMEAALEKFLKENADDIQYAIEHDDDDLKDVLMMRSRCYEDKYDFSDEMWSKLNDR